MTTRVLSIAALVVCACSLSRAETPLSGKAPEEVRVVYRTGTDGDAALRGAAAYAAEVVDLVVSGAGFRPVAVKTDRDIDYLDVSAVDADIIAGAFRYPEMARYWDYLPTTLGTMKISLFTTVTMKEFLKGRTSHDWPAMNLAVVNGSAGLLHPYHEWKSREVVSFREVEYPDVASAVKAVESGECGMMLGMSAPGLAEVCGVGELPYFVAVRYGRRELRDALAASAERLFALEPSRVDALRTKHLGYVKPEKLVRVGRYRESGLCEIAADGSCYGANIDYVNRIAEIAGWSVEWVDCVYPNALKYLENGDIDLLAGVTITEERLEKLNFPNLPTGLYSSYLFCRAKAPYDFDRIMEWKGAVIGTGFGDQANAALRKFLRDRGCNCEVKEYRSFEDAVLGYFRGECQIVVAASSPIFSNERVLHAFESVPAYVVSTRKKPEIGRELQRALEQINALSPDFHDDVARRNFLPRSAQGYHLTDAEIQYLNRRRVNGDMVKLEIFPAVHPLKYWHQGGPSGFLKSLVDIVSSRARLNFTILPPVDFETAKRRFLGGECDFWVDYGVDTSGLPYRYGTIDPVKLMDALICRRDTKLIDPASGRVAVPKWELRSFGYSGGRVGRSEYLLPCNTIRDCIVAVKRGEADCVVCSVLVAASALKEVDTESELEVRPPDISRRHIPFRLVPAPGADPMLVGIVRKVFGSLTHLEIETAESATVVDFVHTPTPTWRKVMNFAFFAVVFVFLIAGVLVWLRARGMVRESSRIDKRSAYRDRYTVKAVKELERSVELIASRAEYLRNPGVQREHVLTWTAEILDNADKVVSRFKQFLSSAERHADRQSRLDGVRVEGGQE